MLARWGVGTIAFGAGVVAIAACSSFGSSTPRDDAATAADSQVPTADAAPDLALGLVAAWAFDEGTGTSTADTLGKNGGDLTGAVTWGAGRPGSKFALQFASETSAVVVLRQASLEVGQTMTFAAWINLDEIARDQYVYSHAYAFAVKLNGRKPQFTTTDGYVVGTFPVPKGWHHLAISFDRGAIAIYVDGVLNPITEKSDTPLVLGTLEPAFGAVRIGTGSELTGSANGSIDDVRLWKRALTPAEIVSLARP